jgi:hypothetical protein
MVAFREGLIDHHLLKLLDQRDPKLARRLAGRIVRSLIDYETNTVSFRRVREDLLNALDADDTNNRPAGQENLE